MTATRIFLYCCCFYLFLFILLFNFFFLFVFLLTFIPLYFIFKNFTFWTSTNPLTNLLNSICTEPSSPLYRFFFTSNFFFPFILWSINTLSASCVAFALPNTDESDRGASCGSFLGCITIVTWTFFEVANNLNFSIAYL